MSRGLGDVYKRQAIFGHKVGDRCEVHVNDNYSYFVQIKRIVNTMDDGTDELRKF